MPTNYRERQYTIDKFSLYAKHKLFDKEARPVKPLEQEKIIKIMVQFSNLNKVMETETIQKNGEILKNLIMSRRNKIIGG